MVRAGDLFLTGSHRDDQHENLSLGEGGGGAGTRRVMQIGSDGAGSVCRSGEEETGGRHTPKTATRDGESLFISPAAVRHKNAQSHRFIYSEHCHFPSDAIDSGAKQKQSLPPSPAFLEASELPARAASRKKRHSFWLLSLRVCCSSTELLLPLRPALLRVPTKLVLLRLSGAYFFVARKWLAKVWGPTWWVAIIPFWKSHQQGRAPLHQHADETHTSAQ
jgi:hypothetical protein